jgi:ABC-type transport system involved in cytochrome c biogenesis permease subunit
MISIIAAITFVIYLVSAVAHGWTWLTRASFFKDPGKVPQQIAIAGWCVQTVGLVFMWLGSNSSALVFSHLGGMVYLLSWFLTMIYLGTQLFVDVRWSGVLNMTLATLLIAFALLSPNTIWTIAPAGIEFETFCFGMNIILNTLGYAFLLTASILAIFILLKERRPLESLMMGYVSFVLVSLLLGIFKWSALFTGTTRIQFEWVEGLSLLLWSVCFILLFFSLFFAKGRDLRSSINWVFSGGLITLGVHLVKISHAVSKSGMGTHLFVILFGLLCAGAVLLRMYWMGEPIERRLPDLHKIESLMFHTTIIGFFCISLGMVTHSSWSYSFIGQYVQWNVKEMWLFVIWLFYGALLHNRIFSEFRNRNFSFYSLLGFFMIMFAVLRVNWVVL